MMDNTQQYIEFWKQNGLNYVTPKGLENPEGFNILEVLLTLIDGDFLEVGCGPGRIASLFPEHQYTGVDINPYAILKAKQRLPNHTFKLINLEEPLPTTDTILLYHVCLHIPDEVIHSQIERLKSTGANTIIIAECMDNGYRKYRTKTQGYHLANQRNREEYMDIMKFHGYLLTETIEKPYEYYKTNNSTVTFLKFSL